MWLTRPNVSKCVGLKMGLQVQFSKQCVAHGIKFSSEITDYRGVLHMELNSVQKLWTIEEY